MHQWFLLMLPYVANCFFKLCVCLVNPQSSHSSFCFPKDGGYESQFLCFGYALAVHYGEGEGSDEVKTIMFSFLHSIAADTAFSGVLLFVEHCSVRIFLQWDWGNN